MVLSWNRRLWLGWVGVTVLLTVACGRETGSMRAPAAARLRDATDRTLAVDSVSITITTTGGDAGLSRTEAIYHAPDRIRMVTTGPIPSEWIIIGDAAYTSVGSSGRFFAVNSGIPSASLDRFLFSAQVTAETESLTESEGIYRARSGEADIEVEVSDGYITRMLLSQTLDRGERVDSVIVLSDFNQDLPSVERPPDEFITTAPTTPECGADGVIPAVGKSLCLGTPTSATTTSLVLDQHAGPADATVQLRSVLSDDAQDCPTGKSDPSSGSAVRLPGVDGGCYELAPAAVELTRATTARVLDVRGGEVDVEIVLVEEDAALFEEFLSLHAGEKVAIVLFGQVFSAPTVGPVPRGDSLVISGLDPETASRVVYSFSG